MFSKARTSALVYGLNYKARAIDAQYKTSKNCFLIGTHTLSETNQIHHIEVNKEISDVKRVAIYDHPHEIWGISSCPTESNLLFTIYNSVPEFKASLWRMEKDSKLTELGTLGHHDGQILSVIWDPHDEKQVVSIETNAIRVWDVNTFKETISIPGTSLDSFTTGSARSTSSFPEKQFVVASGEGVKVFDISSKKEVISIPKAHEKSSVLDVHVNPNNPYYLVTGGDDSRVCFWDVRKPSVALDSFTKHLHWVTHVRFNPYQDALVLSAGTCGAANLWNKSSISFKNPSANQRARPIQDHHVRTFNDHEDSITSLTWGSVNAFIFATVSYDGRVIINRVPDTETEALMS